MQDYVKNGGTIFISTHILEIAKEICTNIGIIYRGKLVYTGHLDDTKLQGRSFEGFFLDLVSRGKGASNDILKDPLEEISAPA